MNRPTIGRVTKASLLGGLALMSGCGVSESPSSTKPTPEQLRELRASVEQVQPVATPTPHIPSFRDWGVKEAAVDALARIGPSSLPVLIEALSDSDPDVRLHAAQALARMGDTGTAAIPILIERLSDPSDAVRQAAARALGQMGPAAAEAAPALISVIRSPEGKATVGAAVGDSPSSR